MSNIISCIKRGGRIYVSVLDIRLSLFDNADQLERINEVEGGKTLRDFANRLKSLED